MPTAVANDIQLYYESHGAGPALVLISGVGYGGWLWYKQIPDFSKNLHAISFDNRGVGKSDQPDEVYNVTMLAQDTLGLMDALGIEKAHVLGTSLGGMVAQQLTLDHPGRVDRLILCNTTFGGANIVMPKPQVLQFMIQRSGTPEERFERGISLAFNPEFIERHPEDICFIKEKLYNPRQSDAAYNRQLMSPLGFNVESRLSELHPPTLVVSGEDDQVVPTENSKRLAAKLPNGQLKTLPGAGHLCFIEQADMFNQIVLDFLGGRA